MKFLLLSVVLTCSSLWAQDFSVTYEKTIGGSQYESMKGIQVPDNSGYFFYGSSSSSISGDKTENSRGGRDLWIVRTDNQYNILWDKTIGGSGDDEFSGFHIYGNFIYFSSTTDSPISGEKTVANYGDRDIWLLKLDFSGNIVWQTVYGGIDLDYFPKLTHTTQGDIVLACNSSSSNSGNITTTNLGYTDVWIAVLDTLDGAIINQRMIGSSQTESFVQLNSFGNRIFIQLYGYIGGDGDIPPLSPNFDEDIVLIELDNSLSIQNTKVFGGDDSDFPGEMLQDAAGDFYFINSSRSSISGNKTSANNGPVGTGDIWLLKLDPNLNVIWDRSYGGSLHEGTGPDFSYIDNGGNLVVLASSNSASGTGLKMSPSYGGQDCWLLTIATSDGNLIREVTFGGSADDYANSAVQVNTAGSVLVTSFSSSPISGNKSVGTNGLDDLWLLELDGSDYLQLPETPNSSNYTVYPNPFHDQITVQLSVPSKFDAIRFYTIDGKLLEEQQLGSSNQYVFEFSDSQAVVFYELIGKSASEHGKLVRQ